MVGPEPPPGGSEDPDYRDRKPPSPLSVAAPVLSKKDVPTCYRHNARVGLPVSLDRLVVHYLRLR